MFGRPIGRAPWLACLWLASFHRAHPAQASRAPSAVVLGPGGAVHGAAPELLGSAPQESRQRHDAPSALLLVDPRAASASLLASKDVGATFLPPTYHKYTESRACIGSYVLLYSLYTAMCVWYELRAPRAAEGAAQAAKEVAGERAAAAAASLAAPGASRQRFADWDAIKAVMLFFVVVLHVGRNGWLEGGLSDSEETFFLMVAPFPMCVFVFISGIFGASIEARSWKKTLCCTIGTFLLAKLLGVLLLLVTPGPKGLGDLLDMGFVVLWYLKALAFWRFTLTPLFHFARKRRVPDAATFAALYVGCYLLRHMGLTSWIQLEWIYFAPYYAQGLMLSPSRWSELLADRRLTFAAVAFLAIWCSSLLLVPAARDWNDVACTRGFVQCPNSHWPASMQFTRRNISASSFLDDTRIYALQDGFSMAVMWLVAACAQPLQAFAPRLAAMICGCGTRTLYGYVLHYLLFLCLGARMGLVFPQMQSWQWAALSFPLALQATFVFCSSLTERLFSWVIMPFWILRIFEQAEA